MAPTQPLIQRLQGLFLGRLRMPRLRIRGDIPLFHLYAFNAWTRTTLPFCKGKIIPIQARTGPQDSRSSKLREFLDSQHMKMKRLSLLSTGHLYPQMTSLVLIFVRGRVDHRHINSIKIPITPSGIEPATFRLREQCRNTLHHRVPHFCFLQLQ